MSMPDDKTMEALLPERLPDGWEILKQHIGPGSVMAVCAHRSPLPEGTSDAEKGLRFVHCGFGFGWLYPYERELPDLDRAAYDCIGAMWISYTKDESRCLVDPETAESAKDAAIAEAETKLAEILKSSEALEALASGELTQGELDKLVADMRGLMGAAAQLRDMSDQGTFLDQRADYFVHGGMRRVSRVIIGRFVITGALLGICEELPDGDTPMHSLECLRARVSHQQWDTSSVGMPDPALTEEPGFKPPKGVRFLGLNPLGKASRYYRDGPMPPCECERCTFHRAEDCSTRATEGFVHREQLQALLEDMFSRIHALS